VAFNVVSEIEGTYRLPVPTVVTGSFEHAVIKPTRTIGIIAIIFFIIISFPIYRIPERYPKGFHNFVKKTSQVFG
jgi:hypothetical protein